MTEVGHEKIIPINGWIMIMLDEDDRLTESGDLYKPDDAYEHLLMRATVLKTSEIPKLNKKTGRWNILQSPVEEGDRILISAIHAHKIYFRHFRKKAGSDRVILVRPEDILVVEDKTREGRGLDDVKLGGGG